MSRLTITCILLVCGSLGCGQASPSATATTPVVDPVVTTEVRGASANPAPEPSSTPPSPPNFYPLESPRTLTYTVEYTAFLIGSGKGKVVTTSTAQIIDGVPYTSQTTKLTGTSWDTTYTKLYRRTEEGIVIRELNAAEDRPFLPLPWEVATQWTMKSGDGIVDCQITAIEDVTCGDITYTGCLKVESSPQAGSTETRWFAPDVGLVRMEVYGPRYKSTTVLTAIER